MTKTLSKIYVGLDVSKDKIDVCILPSKQSFVISNDKAGFKQLINALKEPVGCILMESTSKYHRNAFKALKTKGFPVCVHNPKSIRHFGLALGLMAKTDKADAHICARFACVIEPRETQLLSPVREKLVSLVNTRAKLVKDLCRYKCRLDGADRIERKVYTTVLKTIEKEIDKLETKAKNIIAQHESLQRLVSLLKTVKGIGEIIAITLVARLPELGKLSHGAISAIVGVAPYNKDSGRYKGKRKTSGGRADVRRALYMAVIVATQHNPIMQAYYNRLLAKGKLKKIALVACIRKLIITLNAMVRDNVDWQPKPTTLMS